MYVTPSVMEINLEGENTQKLILGPFQALSCAHTSIDCYS